jgi:ABC-type glycerol-3-phosphate transport system permease component
LVVVHMMCSVSPRVYDVTSSDNFTRVSVTLNGFCEGLAADTYGMVWRVSDQYACDYDGMTHSGGHGDHVGQFRRLFWIMLVVAVPVVAFSHMFAMILGYPLPKTAFIGWISPVHRHGDAVWGGRPFLWCPLRAEARKPGMMLLSRSLAITVAFVASSGRA